MDRPRRRFRLHLDVEGDTWESTGEAFARALRLLMSGKPEEIDPVKGFTAEIPLQRAGFKIEITQDPKMTPEAYAELSAAYRKLTGQP